MFIHVHTLLSAPESLAKLRRQTRTFCQKKEEKTVSQAWVRQPIVVQPQKRIVSFF